ncbi:MAG: hypothetical protein A3F67_01770 [Verrucomicrobia bacterium RIFCSPHIGHO2_12_FULL_41_10]|nr:MAG: hypothetical protein A3F67_01770 [Verrucomicrobia bacterium RIFCSPHIGHO2_12_FULL_41_10]
MKPFFSLGIVGLIFLVSSGLHAQREIQVTGSNQTADTIKVRSKVIALPSGGRSFQPDQQAEITTNYELPIANCDNLGKDLSDHLMMNPAMVEESEEAIEQFILGKTRSALPVKRQNYSENTAREQVAENQQFTPPSPPLLSLY